LAAQDREAQPGLSQRGLRGIQSLSFGRESGYEIHERANALIAQEARQVIAGIIFEHRKELPLVVVREVFGSEV
jgi:hypothetical protein